MTRIAHVALRAAAFLLVFTHCAAAQTASTDTAVVPAATAQHEVSPDQENFRAVGGQHEFNVYLGHSWHGGPALGFVRDTNFTVVALGWSYRIADYPLLDIRYAPEIVPFATLFENSPSPDNINTRVPIRDLGGGVSPVGFRFVLLPRHRVQPFVTTNAGMLFYNHPVLSDGGSAFMFSVDLGAGSNIFVSRRNAVVVGFRYHHQSNANLGVHNPGADSELFTFGFSHFLTRGIR